MANLTFTRPPQRPHLRSQATFLNIDVPLLLGTFTLTIFGVLMVYSASWDFSYLYYDDPNYIFSRQMLWLVIGIATAVTTALLDYHYWKRLALPAMLFILVGLAAVLVIGELRNGSTRTLISGSYMPSEAAKIITIIYLAVWLNSKRNQLHDINFGLIPLGGIIGIVSGLILAQPDLSAAATIIFLGGVLFFVAGGDLKQIFILLVLTIIVGWVVVQIHPTGSRRIANYMQTIKDPSQAEYHVIRSFEAFLNGGLFGVGIGKSAAKLTGLPLPPTDSIFAVVAEETGIVGTTFLLSLYMVLLWRGIVIARKAPDVLGSLLAVGLTLWIVAEACINMAVMVGLLPFAGNTLPFISAGGSSLVVTFAAIGILMNVARMSNDSPQANERINDASDGLRRGDRRGRVSRSGGNTGSW